ncbi:MAG: valine--tRNA ligase, partial [Candidatus Doudnabacteria bacterium]|nr:valine--tRNA ligase [Candidatus Doudnabacteria bacterium]
MSHAPRSTSHDLPKFYDQSKEPDIYKLWELSGYFNPDNLEGKPYTIIMPPLNANAAPHVGHALGMTLQDIMIRFHRMKGFKTLWLPGTDHAGFETQVVFEKKLEKEGRSRFKMQRQEFYQETWDFVQENKSLTEQAIRRMGASCDWSRNIFTLDPRIVSIVYETFERMYRDELIYRGNRISNWCIKHQTGLSDLETKYEERQDPLYYIKYGPFVLATVRPETKFGDTALAVNPTDERYQEYIGQEIDAEGILGKFKIKVIADEAVDKEFGTGIVKVTPAHDAVDFEIWQRHKDEIPGPIQVIDKFGRMDLSHFQGNPEAQKFHGLKVAEARKLVVESLNALRLIEKIDEGYKHNVQLCYKCNSVIEPLIVPQWYIAMSKQVNGKSLKDFGIEAVTNKEVTILPEAREKVYMHWLENLRDWPISRQIWWGIPIPVWYRGDEIKISADSPGDDWVQDPDTFDTWFSSGQWPYATLKAFSENDLTAYYPTTIMETGWDILFFWVARMIMLGKYVTGKAPFETVYLHGLVRDQNRQKMSKSKGNVVDPLAVIDKYGNDALRMALVVGILPGVDNSISDDKIRGYRNFANKIWNASRFVSQNTHDTPPDAKLSEDDQKLIDELEAQVTEITKLMEAYDFAHASENLYHYFWHTFADKIIEESKVKLANDTTKASAQTMLRTILETSLKLLHPFMPFVTETIWQLEHKELLMIQRWPT